MDQPTQEFLNLTILAWITAAPLIGALINLVFGRWLSKQAVHTVAPDATLVDAFMAAGGAGKPRAGQLHVCFADHADDARRTVARWWPNGALPPVLNAELSRPRDFADACRLVDEGAAAAAVTVGRDPAPFARAAFYIDLLADRGPLLDEPYTRQLESQLRELRFHLGTSATRITYWIAPGRRIILLTVFTKTRMREDRQVDRARRALTRCIAEQHNTNEED